MSIKTERDDHTLVVTMSRPLKRNALNAAMRTGIDAAMNKFEDDPHLCCSILTGTESVFPGAAI